LISYLVFFFFCFTDHFCQLFSAQASGLSELIGPPPLAYKKWRFDGQSYITDIASCGELHENDSYEHTLNLQITLCVSSSFTAMKGAWSINGSYNNQPPKYKQKTSNMWAFL